jgi:transposase
LTRKGAKIVPTPLLPSRAPELNPVENIWQYLRANWLSNRVFENFEESSTPPATPGTNSLLNLRRSHRSECDSGRM